MATPILRSLRHTYQQSGRLRHRPCANKTSACRNFETISSGLCLLLGIATRFQVNLQRNAAILPQNDRIGTDVSAIAAQILSSPQIKRAIVQRTQDSCSADEAVSQRSPSMRAIGLRREHLARVGVVDGIAILDRLLHHSHVLTIRGDSYRLREERRRRPLQKLPLALQTTPA